MIKISKLTYIYDNKSPFSKQVLSNVNLTINSGDRILLCARSGIGKSTLMNLITGLLKPTSGMIDNRFKSTGYLIQNSNKQITYNNLYNEIDAGYYLKYQKHIEQDTINYWLDKFKLDLKLEDNPFYLSGGQKKIISIISLLVLNHDFIILDEPLEHLDSIRQKILIEVLASLDITLIIISHNINKLYQSCDQVIYYDNDFIKTDLISFMKINLDLMIVPDPDIHQFMTLYQLDAIPSIEELQCLI